MRSPQADLFEDIDTPDELLETSRELRLFAATLNRDPAVLTEEEMSPALRDQLRQATRITRPTGRRK